MVLLCGFGSVATLLALLKLISFSALLILVVALFSGLYFIPVLDPYLRLFLTNTSFIQVAAFLIGFLSGLLLGALLQRGASKLINKAGLTGFDRTLGGLFGGFRGILFCVVLLVVMRPYVGQALWWESSKFEPILSVFEEDLVRFTYSVRGYFQESKLFM